MIFFFNEVTTTLKKVSLTYKKLIVMEDFNIYPKPKRKFQKILEEFVDSLSLANLIESKTCHTKVHKSHIDLILTVNCCYLKLLISQTQVSLQAQCNISQNSFISLKIQNYMVQKLHSLWWIRVFTPYKKSKYYFRCCRSISVLWLNNKFVS